MNCTARHTTDVRDPENKKFRDSNTPSLSILRGKSGKHKAKIFMFFYLWLCVELLGKSFYNLVLSSEKGSRYLLRVLEGIKFHQLVYNLIYSADVANLIYLT